MKKKRRRGEEKKRKRKRGEKERRRENLFFYRGSIYTFYVHSTILKISAPAAGTHLGFFSLRSKKPTWGVGFFFPRNSRNWESQERLDNPDNSNNSDIPKKKLA